MVFSLDDILNILCTNLFYVWRSVFEFLHFLRCYSSCLQHQTDIQPSKFPLFPFLPLCVPHALAANVFLESSMWLYLPLLSSLHRNSYDSYFLPHESPHAFDSLIAFAFDVYEFFRRV